MPLQTFKLKINQDQILYIDESGNLGRGDRYFVITVVRFRTKAGYRKWRNVAYMFLNKYPFLTTTTKKKREVKGYNMPDPIREEIMEAIQGIDFDIYYAVIDTNHPHYKNKFIQTNASEEDEEEIPSKEIAFNYTLGKLFDRYIAKHINTEKIFINIDQRSVKTGAKHDLTGYLNHLSKGNEKHSCNEVKVHYCDSATESGIQLADLISNTLYQFYESGKKKNKSLYSKYIKPRVKGRRVRYPEFY